MIPHWRRLILPVGEKHLNQRHHLPRHCSYLPWEKRGTHKWRDQPGRAPLKLGRAPLKSSRWQQRGARLLATRARLLATGPERTILAGQSEDNSGSSWVVKGGVATRTPPPRKDKGAHARANDDEGALGGNAAVDKECALGGGQSKDNSGGGGGGGGARGGGAKGVIGAAKEKRTRGNDVEEGGWGPTTKKQKRKLPLKRNQPSSTSVDAVLGGDASAAVASGSALEAPADSCVQCTWSLYQSLQTCMPCGRVQEADTDMISLQYPFLNLFTGLVSPFAMVHWMVNRLHSSIVGRSTTHDTIPLLLRTSNSADGVR